MNQNKIREALLSAHLQLVNNELVKGTSGNISLRIGKNIIIKPSGVSYNLLKRSDFVVVSIENNRVIKGTLKPSTDTQSHIEIYKNLPDVNSVIHTHSPYATAFAVAGKPIPCYMTSIADEFGGDIPIGKMVDIGDDKIGHEFARVYKKFRSDVVLMKGHGVFAASDTLESCLKHVISVEEIAKTIHYSMKLSKIKKLPKKIIDSCWNRYSNTYGQ
tara:strand:+ start:2463 stop:3110 length:648 start_codon:yes stop_codon:yes gene_type:complete